jgi:decaprenyl-phosphate phosphoribosyltransferase
VLNSLVRALRPRQWSKNLLVFVAPAAAGAFHHRGTILDSLGAFGIFCAAASSTYLLNDSMDADSDRLHPVKQNRPIASGDLAIPVAISAGVILGVGSVVVTAAYSLYFKRVPVVELAFLASGFVLRALAGGIATHVPISTWFLAVTSFGALFVAAGKRSAELKALGDDSEDHREVLGDYTTSFLQSTLTLTAGVTVAAYCLWAFGSEGLAQGLGRSIHHDTIWIQLSVVPVTLGILHVLRLLDRGEGGAPEDLVFRDRVLQILGVMWVAFFAAGVYG